MLHAFHSTNYYFPLKTGSGTAAVFLSLSLPLPSYLRKIVPFWQHGTPEFDETIKIGKAVLLSVFLLLFSQCVILTVKTDR